MKKERILKFFSILGVSIFCFSNITATTISDYHSQISEIKNQQKQAAEKLTGVEKEIQENLYDIMDLDEKVTKYTLELANLQTKVDDVNAKISTYEKALSETSQIHANANDIYKTRIRVIYENGIPTFWDILFTSKGISDFFAKMNVYTSILEYDKNLLTNIQSQKEYIDFVKKDIEVQKLQLEQLTYDIQKSTDTLNDAITAKEAKNNELQSDKANLQKTQAALKQQQATAQKQLNDEIERINRQNQASGNNIQVFSGQFEWPVPGYYTISAKFGYYDPWNTGSLVKHTGADIAGSAISGKQIIAIEEGTVAIARYYGGYGNCVMINHGNTYISVYGHASALAVTQGQTVKKGQVIAYVGSTGNSTGPHLHLEIRKNGTALDPLTYYGGLSLRYL